jgi:hypothetical protein
LWKALALSNGWRLPDDVDTATRDIVAKLNDKAKAKATPATGSGAWKAWFIRALVERVLDGKTERELVAAEDDHHQTKKKRVHRGFADTNEAGGEEAEAADDGEEEDEDEEEDVASYSNSSKVQMASRQVVVSRPIGLDDEPAGEVPMPLRRSPSSFFFVLLRSLRVALRSFQLTSGGGARSPQELQGGTVWGILNFLLTEDMPNSTTRAVAWPTLAAAAHVCISSWLSLWCTPTSVPCVCLCRVCVCLVLCVVRREGHSGIPDYTHAVH